MSGSLKLLLRLLVQRYYMINSGFFLVVFLLVFGIIDPAASIRLHADLIRLMPQKPEILAVALLALSVYFIKCLRFGILLPQQPENAMLYELQALPAARLRTALGIAFTAIYAPALAYAGCVIVLSVQHGAWWVAAVTAIVQIALLLVAVQLLGRRITHRLRPPAFSALQRRLEALRPDYLRFGQYFTAYLLSGKKLMLLLLKASSLLMLQLMVYINKDEPERAGTFYVLLFLIVAHGLIPWQLRQFSEGLPWLRNLPLSLMRRFLAFAGTYALLFLPELVFLLLHVHTSLSLLDMASFYALSAAMLCGFHAMLYLPGFNMDRYIMVLMVVYPVSIVSLAVLSPWILAGCWALLSMAVFAVRYHRFESPE